MTPTIGTTEQWAAWRVRLPPLGFTTHHEAMSKLTFISLFSGIGGIDVGLERAGMTCVAQVEIDEFCQRVLAKHWPNVERFRDVRDYKPKQGAADVVAGGFPCQPFSLAGKRGGRQDERALWPHFARIVDAVRPTWIVAENVPGLRTLGADEVLEDLEALGYACWPLVVGACDVGAPHRRKRVFIVAYCESIGWPRQGERRESEIAGTGSTGADGVEHAAIQRPERAGVEGRRESVRPADASELADADCGGRNRAWLPSESRQGVSDTAGNGRRIQDWPARPGEHQHEWEEPRTIRGMADAESESPRGAGQPRQSADSGPVERKVGSPTPRLPKRLARWNRAALKALGNAVVPQVAEVIGRAILEAQPA